MDPVTITTKRLTVSADLPTAVAGALRRLRRARQAPGRAGRLAIGGDIHAVRPQRRDPGEAVPFFKSIYEKMGSSDTFGPALADGWGADELANAVDSLWWYHTIDLPHGVTTSGAYDHRSLVSQYGLPDDLQGETVLDVATFDGFWAFEFERRGASVIATDIPRIRDLDLPQPVRDRLLKDGIDWETGTAFRLAHQALSSSVERVEVSIYDLDPDNIGTFDLVHVSDLLLHLRDPIAALAAVARVTSGRAIVTDCYDPDIPSGLTRYSGGWSGATWWLPSLETLVQMTGDAGFSDVQVQHTYSLPTVNATRGYWRASLLATK